MPLKAIQPDCRGLLSTVPREAAMMNYLEGAACLSTNMSTEQEPEMMLEIGYLLLMDVVGYSKLLVNEQVEVIKELNRVVRAAPSFREAEGSSKLIRLATGDGMALVFFRSPEEPVRCALEVSQALRSRPEIRLRMGIHSGPVSQVSDVNDAVNVAGSGINVAQRVLDCGDAGHILLSKHVADDLAPYRHWQPYLLDLGQCEVKHGLRLAIFSLCKDGLGNPAPPDKLRRGKRWKWTALSQVRPIRAPVWPKWALAAALLASIAAAGISILWYQGAPPGATPGPRVTRAPTLPEKSIAVLPFDNLSNEKENIYFADAVQDEILNNLAKVADIKVISRTSVMQYRNGVGRNLRAIASELGVAHILEGTVQRAGNRVRVSAQLIDARSDTHLWSNLYVRDLSDVFALESELAKEIAAQLKAKLSPDEKAAIEKTPTTSVNAYELYVRARTALSQTTFTTSRQNRAEAIDLLNQAIQIDPSFFLAYCLLAREHTEMYLVGLDHTPQRLILAEEALKKVETLRPDSGEYHLAIATYLYGGYLDYARAARELDIARRSLPNEPSVFELAGYVHRRQGHWRESIQDLEHAVALDPLNFDYLEQLAQSYSKMRDYPRLAETLDRALRIAPADAGLRLKRAFVPLDSRADTKPLHQAFEVMLAENPSLASTLADDWIDLALCERDFAAAEKAVASMPNEGGSIEGFVFPKSWFQALVRRARGDLAGANESFIAARAQVEKTVHKQPDYAEALSVLGLIDAGLGRKEDAIREGERAVALLPLQKDAINGILSIEYLAVIYGWLGETDRAFERLATAAREPGDLSYGQLKLRPMWDPLRQDPRFEKILRSLGPK